MVGNRVAVLGLVFACSWLAGCIGEPFEAGVADTETSDAGPVAPSSGDAGVPKADVREDAGEAAAKVDTGVVVDAPDAGKVDSGSMATEVADAGVDALAEDAGPVSCDGGSVYAHPVGLLGLTWQDCVPPDTYGAAQALAACSAYALAVGAGACSVNVEPMGPVCGSSVAVSWDGALVAWLYGVSSGQKGAVGHVSTDGVCPGMSDPEWD